MSFRELSMIEIREGLRRWTAGQAVRAVARETGVDRKTVARYVAATREFGLERGAEATETLITEVSQRTPRAVAGTSARMDHCCECLRNASPGSPVRGPPQCESRVGTVNGAAKLDRWMTVSIHRDPEASDGLAVLEHREC